MLAWYIQSDSHSDLIQEWSRILAPPSNEDSGDGDDDVAIIENDYRSEFRKSLCRDIATLAEKIMKEIKQAQWDWENNFVGKPSLPLRCILRFAL